MSESAWEYQNDWRSLRGNYPTLTPINLQLEYSRREGWLLVWVALLGFHCFLTIYTKPQGRLDRDGWAESFEHDYSTAFRGPEIGREHGA